MAIRPVLSALVTAALITSCGGGDDGPAWEQVYEDRLQTKFDALSPAEVTAFCTEAGALTDAEIRAQFGAQAGGDNEFDKLMTERGETPTAEDYTRALDIAVAKLRSNCA